MREVQEKDAKRLGSAVDLLWYRDALIYELHVRAFKDSNADGIEDFLSLIQKLDYLQNLNITCRWLLPFFTTSPKDDGYAISDYLNVHPMYGTIDNFREFLAAAQDRGRQVMIELVVNHTSDEHPWFQAARRAPRLARARLLCCGEEAPAKTSGDTRGNQSSGARLALAISNHMLPAEASQWPSDVQPYFGDGDECRWSSISR